MDIIFQSGDFYNDTNSFWFNALSIIASLFGAIISGVIAIHIYKRGVKNDLKKRNEEIKEKNRQLELFLFHNINSLCYFIDSQIDLIRQCSSNSKDWNHNYLILSLLSELSIDNYWGIKQDELYTVFMNSRIGKTEEKVVDYVNIRNSIKNINYFIETEKRANKEIENRLVAQVSIWNQNLNKLLEYNNKFVLEYNKLTDKKSDSFLKVYYNLVTIKQRELIVKGLQQNMQIVYDEIIKPMKLHIGEKANSTDSRIPQISEPLINLINCHTEVKFLRKQRREHILTGGRNLLSIKRLLKNSMERMNKREMKI